MCATVPSAAGFGAKLAGWGESMARPARRQLPSTPTAMDWTKDRIEPLTTAEVRQLRANAETLGKVDVLALCDEVLSQRPKRAAAHRVGRTRLPDDRHLVSRSK